ncbi:M23 family metallopeptidase [Parahaliea mediterranea]|uniref:Peptidoglycan DD-metalloendopeptidase family protein n=1 Tax=Parahaliea mediterranea TaxID=651086 RepID=A0A939DC71_9GAMM|nr:M23 family metallopeptidase [Parahaliea mediterranea]MBN7795385.1 peptidoglycan DD-metalloendopeptidase family protein [Parahaliea mediterranea]
MKVIVINRKHGGSRSFELGRWSRALLSLCCLGLPLGMVAAGYVAGLESEAQALRGESVDAMADELAQQSQELEAIRDEAEQKLQALTLSLAELQARMTRLDALGEHLTAMAELEDGEFDFSQPPALGGPLAGEFEVDYSSLDLTGELESFSRRLSDREQQLAILESLLNNRRLEDEAWLSGRPIEKGWVSSHYGKRNDPFTGQPAFHHGIDFAGKEGSGVLAVAGGVVTWVGERAGYGHMVEISHGDGLVSRYGHNKQNLVAPGDVVRKGETIALMGSSGRSTGAHVHFEVYKHGRSVDPSSYVRRTRR